MSRRRSRVMNEKFKEELAKDLGFYETVESKGWKGIRAEDAGNMVKRAVEMAKQGLVEGQYKK
ncbi:small, acid-soluble spore protein, alpha/beta type [Bacillus sp. HMF5848]|uniref:small, acid-soluble spore protein, alpha/beta type n=1 Tax=Bacillus sp. HMF5848 TaxID=2495421 RepID=UPI000F787B16|nr:small, acid-soluble spore protein, alpha/beta type [Bacillus sp. HMF5848]RSK25478.1 small, acid-soluble spore protein, alpha/beta type [Bacillus sp. HMF5848]